MELHLWRLPCNLTRTDGSMDLAVKDKGTPHSVGGSSSPMKTDRFLERQVRWSGIPITLSILKNML